MSKDIGMETELDAAHLLSRFPNLAKLARALRVPRATVTAWKSRNSIPGGFDDDLLDAAGQFGVKLSAAELREMRRRRRAARLRERESRRAAG